MIEIIDNHGVIELVTNHGVIEFIASGPRGLPGPPGISLATMSANGVIAPEDASVVWVLITTLSFNPAGLLFWNDDGEEMEPESIEYAALGVILVTWLVARSGSWQAS